MNKKKSIHRGKFLKQIVEESGISITALTKKAGYKDRASYYAHIEKENLSFDILSNYARIIKYDLRTAFPDMAGFLFEEPPAVYNAVPSDLPQAIELLQKWKDRYYILLEKYVENIERAGKGV